MRSPPTSWAIAARSCVVVMTFSLPCACAVDPASQATATSAAIESRLRQGFGAPSRDCISCLLEGVRPMRTDRELQLEQQFVGDLIAGIGRAAVLPAHLAELARPERQRRRAALVAQRQIRRAVRSVVAPTDEPAARELVVARHVEAAAGRR